MISKVYLKKEVMNEMEKFFEENGFIQLNSFLDEGVEEFYRVLNKLDCFVKIETEIERKKRVDLKEVFRFEVLKFVEFFKSKEFLHFVEKVTDFDLRLENLEINVFNKGDFVDLDFSKKKEEGIFVVFDVSDEFDKEEGGTLTFATNEEEVFYLEPSFNSISIFYDPDDIYCYLSEISKKVKEKKIIRFEINFSISE